jgi:recombination protein RecT
MKTDGSDFKNGDKSVTTKKHKTIYDLIQSMEGQIKKALPQHLTSERLTRIAVTAVRQNPKLANCTAVSLLGGIMQSAQLGLEPNTPLGQAYLIPYFNKKKDSYECSFQLGYKGVLELAHRTNIYGQILAMEVYREDDFSYHYGLNPDLVHVPAAKQTGIPIYYYAMYRTLAGGVDFRVWSREKIELHAQEFSKSWDGSKFQAGSSWADNFDSMAKKTVLLDLLKYAPKNVEIQEGQRLAKALRIDEQISEAEIRDDGITIKSDYEVEDVESEPVESEEQEQPIEPEDVESPGEIGLF